MALFRVRRGIEEFGAFEDDIVVAISPDYTEGQTFPIIGSHHAASAGYAGATVVDDTRDFSAWPRLNANLAELELYRESSAAAFDRVVPWELLEFLGDASSPDGFEVLGVVGTRMLGGVSSGSSSILADPADVGQVIPFLIGTDYAGGATPIDADRKTTLKIQTTGRVLVERGASSGTLTVFFAVVKFGAAWTIENNIEHNFAAAGAVETETITSVDWSKTFCEGRVRGPGSGLDEAGAIIFPGAATTIKQKLRAGASNPTSFYTVCHTASHPGLSVEHLDSVDGGEPDFSSIAQTVTVTVGAVDTSRTFLLGSNDCGGSGTAYPRQYWGFDLRSATSVVWDRARTGQASEWALQVIELPDGETLTPSSAVLDLNAPATALARALTPGPAALELASPPSSVSRVLTPSAAALILNAPATALGLALTPSPAALGLTAPPSVIVKTLRLRGTKLELVAPPPELSIVLTPSPAVLNLRGLSAALSLEVAPSAAVLDLVATSPDIGTPVVLTPSPAILSLAGLRASLDFPGACKVPFTPASSETISADLALSGFSESLSAAERLSSDLPASGYAESLPAVATLSVSLQVCP